MDSGPKLAGKKQIYYRYKGTLNELNIFNDVYMYIYKYNSNNNLKVDFQYLCQYLITFVFLEKIH